MEIFSVKINNNLQNLNYIIQDSRGNCLVVDPTDGQLIEKKVDLLNGCIKYIFNTHQHSDHISGNQYLIEKYNAVVVTKENFYHISNSLIFQDNSVLKLLETPGHTLDHLTLKVMQNGVLHAIFTGDTLFNAGVGNCIGEGDIVALYQTIFNMFLTFYEDAIIYPGHDYLITNLKFTLSIEKNNIYAKNLLIKLRDEAYKAKFKSNFNIEKKINLFLRLNNIEVIERLQQLGFNNLNSKDVFFALRELRNSWDGNEV